MERVTSHEVERVRRAARAIARRAFAEGMQSASPHVVPSDEDVEEAWRESRARRDVEGTSSVRRA